MLWAPSIKRGLGNVYHIARVDDVAACNRNIRLEAAGYAQERDDGYRCARCLSLSKTTLRRLKPTEQSKR